MLVRTRSARMLLSTVSAFCAAAITTGTANADLGDSELRSVTDHYLYEISLTGFVDVRAQRPYDDQLDWSSDACSWSPDEPLGYEFTNSCHRHDFGYRNYKAQSRFTESNRERIDNNFRDDMYSTCDGSSVCESAADVYYYAVRQFGSSSTSTAEAVEKADIDVRTAPSGEVISLQATGADGVTRQFPVRD